MKWRSVTATLVTSLVAAVGLPWLGAATSASASTALVGTFDLTPGSCAHSVSGTYLQMILPSGSSSGPYMSNSDSSCSDQAYTPLSGGTDGGLISGSYQPAPNPPFTSSGNARADRITAPATYEGTAFATATQPVDPQTRVKVPAPTVVDHNGALTADLRSFAVTWNNQYFNQGSPKPDGGYPGNTRPASGTYDAATGAFTLNWTSQVVGGPFDKFTGKWHLVGHFYPASSPTGSGSSANGSHSGASGAGSATTTHSGGTAGSTSGSTSSDALPGGVGALGKGAGSGRAARSGSSTAGSTAAPTVAGQTAAATTSTVSRESWHASWWLIGLAIALALVGFGVLIALSRLQRQTAAAPS